MTAPALVIFDMAGTTVEDRGQVPAAFEEALRAAGVTVGPDEINRVRGASKRQAIRRLLPEDRQSRADAIYLDFRQRLAARYSQDVNEIAGASAAMQSLIDRGIKVMLNTGFDREITALLLSRLGWTFPVVCGDEVAHGRPAPDLILKAMSVSGVGDASRVANVGDTTVDLQAAANAGVRWNIGVLSGAHTREQLEPWPHTALIQSVRELDEGLRTWGLGT
jgi:phosphonatase-like hydrolase